MIPHLFFHAEPKPSPTSRARTHFASIPRPSTTNISIIHPPIPISSASQPSFPARKRPASWNAYDLVRPWYDLLARPRDRRSSTGIPSPRPALSSKLAIRSFLCGSRPSSLSDSLSSPPFRGKSMSGRNPSTSFPAGPLSPSSPAAGPLKENRQLLVSSDHIPQTPTSPPLMSVIDPSHVSNFTSSHTSPNQATFQPPNTSSPPSSTPMSAQASQPTMSTTNSFPTPASSVSGHLTNTTSVEDAEHQPSRAGMQESKRASEGADDQQPSKYRRTDHDRQPSVPGPETGIRDFASERDSRTTAADAGADAMDVDTEPVALRNLGLDSLQKDFTSAFHLCKSCKNPPTAALAVV